MSRKDINDDVVKKDLEWALEQERVEIEGREIVKKAANDAIDYLEDILTNISDKEWRRMAVDTRAVEMGVGTAIIRKIEPIVNDMQKHMPKELGVDKLTAEMLTNIYLGTVIKNVVKALNDRAN